MAVELVRLYDMYIQQNFCDESIEIVIYMQSVLYSEVKMCIIIGPNKCYL